MKKVITEMLTLLVMCSCLDRALDNRKITIVNDSKKAIYCLFSQNDSIKNPYILYPDSVINFYYKVEAKKTVILHDSPRSWQSYIENSENGKMRIFVISNDSVIKNGWKQILIHNNYIHLFKLTLQDLKDLDWRIVYDDIN